MTTEYIAPLILLAIGIAMIVTGAVGLKRRPRNRIEPKPPWDGTHKLRSLKYFEWCGGMDEFHTGWIWECTCGIGNNHLYWRLPHNEELAIGEYRKHKQNHKDLEKSFGS
jgi:hypothetical protein